MHVQAACTRLSPTARGVRISRSSIGTVRCILVGITCTCNVLVVGCEPWCGSHIAYEIIRTLPVYTYHTCFTVRNKESTCTARVCLPARLHQSEARPSLASLLDAVVRETRQVRLHALTYIRAVSPPSSHRSSHPQPRRACTVPPMYAAPISFQGCAQCTGTISSALPLRRQPAAAYPGACAYGGQVRRRRLFFWGITDSS